MNLLRNVFRATGLSLSFLITPIAVGAEILTTDEIRKGYQQHAALTQLYRWYLLYENPDYGIDNALDILSSDVQVTSGLGEARGHDQYAERVKQLPTSWRNAHNVRSSNVAFDAESGISLTANIVYLNQGLLEDGSVRSAELSYTMAMVPGDSLLPKVTHVDIEQNSESTVETFESTYAENRLLSLVHYWLALIEDPARNPEPVREILAADFSLNFSSGAVTDFDAFRAWLAGPGSQVVASTHIISDFTATETDVNRYSATMVFDWNGILPDESEMTAKTRHTWVVVDDPTERFARIESMDVEVLEPFSPKP